MSVRSIFVVALLVVATTSAIFLYLEYNPNNNVATTLNISAECNLAASRTQCLDSRLIEYTDANPSTIGAVLSGFWHLEQDSKLDDDPRIFSDIAHIVGMKLADKGFSPKQAVAYCGSSFKDGCLHGAIMEYIDSKYPNRIDPTALFKMCNDFESLGTLAETNCFHAAGHELQAKNFSTLNTTLGLCSILSTVNTLACQSGVLMEYSKGNLGTGKHAEMSAGSAAIPCPQLDGKYKSICNLADGSYRQYIPGREDFLASYTYCSGVEAGYLFDCMVGVSAQLLYSKAENYPEATSVCQSIANASIKSGCTASLKKAYADYQT